MDDICVPRLRTLSSNYFTYFCLFEFIFFSKLCFSFCYFHRLNVPMIANILVGILFQLNESNSIDILFDVFLSKQRHCRIDIWSRTTIPNDIPVQLNDDWFPTVRISATHLNIILNLYHDTSPNDDRNDVNALNKTTYSKPHLTHFLGERFKHVFAFLSLCRKKKIRNFVCATWLSWLLLVASFP